LIESGSQLGELPRQRGVTFSGIFHAWENRFIGEIGWEIVTDCVKLNGDKLPDFNSSQQPLETSGFGKWFFVHPMAEEKCIDAVWDIRIMKTPTSVSLIMGIGYSNKLVKEVYPNTLQSDY